MEKDYSWGEFYETMVEMEKKGDTTKNEIFEKCSKLFSALDSATTLKKVQNIIKKFPLTEYEQNYINSSCLDGILLSAKAEKPLNALVKKGEYIETCKYYLSKKMVKRCLYKAIKYGRLKTVELLVKKYEADINVNRKPYYLPVSYATLKGHVEIAKFLIENDANLDRGFDDVGGYEGYVCECNNLELAKYLFNRDRAYGSTMLHSAFYQRSKEIVKFLLENGVDPNENNIQEQIIYCCDDEWEIWEWVYKYGFIINEELLEYLINAINFLGIHFSLTKIDTISEENAKKILKMIFKNKDAIEEYGSEIVTLLVQKGISFDIIKKAIGPVFDCVKTVLELKGKN